MKATLVYPNILADGKPVQFAIDYAPAQMHSQTSIAAAEAILPHAGSIERAVYECFVAAGERGLTDLELVVVVKAKGWPIVGEGTCRARRVHLVERGLIFNSCRTRPARSGRQAAVWKVVE